MKFRIWKDYCRFGLHRALYARNPHAVISKREEEVVKTTCGYRTLVTIHYNNDKSFYKGKKIS